MRFFSFGELISNNVRRLRNGEIGGVAPNGGDVTSNGTASKSVSLNYVPNGTFAGMSASCGDEAAIDDIISTIKANLNVLKFQVILFLIYGH